LKLFYGKNISFSHVVVIKEHAILTAVVRDSSNKKKTRVNLRLFVHNNDDVIKEREIACVLS